LTPKCADRVCRGVPEEESELDFYKGTLEDLGKIRDEEVRSSSLAAFKSSCNLWSCRVLSKARQGLDPLANLGIKRSKKFFAAR